MRNIIAIAGGLGNQMFQYAFSLTLDRQDDTYLNDYLAKHGISNYGSELERVFELKMRNQLFDNFLVWFARKCIVLISVRKGRIFFLLLIKLLRSIGIVIKSDYLPQLIKLAEKKCYKSIWYGRFQSNHFLVGYEEILKTTFTFNHSLASHKTQDIVERITRENSVSLHVRRGDYLSPSNVAVFGNICTLEYYNKAIRHILDSVESPIFYIFSDDIPWVEENLELPNAHFIDWNGGTKSWEDMYLMSLCKHNIIANSTFSWWGAWLNSYPDKKVIHPPKYVNAEDSKGFFPDDWIDIIGK